MITTFADYDKCKHDFKLKYPANFASLEFQCKKCNWVFGLRSRFEPIYKPDSIKVKVPESGVKSK